MLTFRGGGIPSLEAVCQARHLLRAGFSTDQAVRLIQFRRHVAAGSCAGDAEPDWHMRARWVRYLIATGRLSDSPTGAEEVAA